ncbi:cation diffusion facilitator family transporter [Paucisalibacillus sp. EB02]|uniref:cation diffusion facilitator family transporter n=1 Tax=Paucisalibacillus sp. EB02 TaxID=1347087 RepID=UPI0004B458C6|nr:cation diffusion facilitator family transporter [Paucisalibacillus sp. EB02]
MGNHYHNHHHTTNKRVLLISFIAIFTFMIVEAIGGFLTNSLALVSDAGHMLSDAAALGLSLVAFKIGERKATKEKTYGYKRFEVIAAFLNGVTLIIISLYIFYEAITRFVEPQKVDSSMIFIATLGLFVNIGVAFLLMKGDSKDNLNIRSALLHVIGDLLGSVGAIVAGLLIIAFGWYMADPIASIIVAILIIISGFRVTRDSLHVLMEGKPNNIQPNDILKELIKIEGVVNVYDLNIWSITSVLPMLSCHIVVEEDIDRDELITKGNEILKNSFNINHCTLQIEGKNISSHTCIHCN